MMLSAHKAISLVVVAFICWGWGIAHAQDAEVVMAVGRVEMRETDNADWQPLKEGQKLRAGSTVRTGELSQAALVLKGQTQIRVNQLSTLRLKTVESELETSVDLLRGRIWGQVKRLLRSVTAAVDKPRAVSVSTATATIGIRGTDWDVEVGPDNKTTLTVLSGEAEVGNQYGRIAVASNEQAVVEAGKAPAKQLLTNARDRVQWVTAYRPDPRRWAPRVPAELESTVRAIESEDYVNALKQLETQVGLSVEATLLLADFYLYLGRADDAIKLVAPLMQTGNAMATALHGRALILAGRLDDARTSLAAGVARHPGEMEVALALADVARLQGDVDVALRAFTDIAAVNPDSHAAWFGVGRIQNEKEDVKAARNALDTAIRLAPAANGYHGERATLEALAGNYEDARKAFDEALRLQPDDYLSWTGLGILQLKTGRTAEALESFLKAGVIEPRFARAQLYAGVAYYRLENTPRAVESLIRATELDPKDPLPFVMLALIHGDGLELRKSVEAAQEAQVRMPYLRSLNQVLNNQKGSANVGSALAAQGMEEWAQAYASESYNPYWAGSALFLSNRYPDGFNKNTELYKGFLLDPLVLGASNRASSLVQVPGHYGSVSYIGTRADFSQNAVQAKANGLTTTEVPIAYSITGEYADGHDNRPGQNAFQAYGNNFTVGLGAKPNFETGLFYFGNITDVDGHFSSPTLLPDANLSVAANRQDAGMSYRIGPDNQLMFKVGGGSQKTRLSGTQIDAANAAALSAPPILTTASQAQLDRNDVDIDQSDLQLRHSVQLTRATRLTWGAEDSRNKLNLVRDQTFSAAMAPCATFVPLALTPPGCVPVPLLHTDVAQDLRSSGFNLSALHAVSAEMDVQLDLNYQDVRATGLIKQDSRIVDRRPGGGADILPPGILTSTVSESEAHSEWNPRFGLRFSPEPGNHLRMAYQRWRRPFGTGSLWLTDTVGIPIEDRLVDAGGQLERMKIRYDWEFSRRGFVQFSADQRNVENLQNQSSAFFRQFGLNDLEVLRPRKPVFDQPFDPLERTPVFSRGKVSTGGAALNWLMTDAVSVAARYAYSDSQNTGAAFNGKDVPLIPQHFANVSGFWNLGGRWLLSAAATYRSARYVDEANTILLNSGWNMGLRTYWETRDKRTSLEAAVTNIHSDKNSSLEYRTRLDVIGTYRF